MAMQAKMIIICLKGTQPKADGKKKQSGFFGFCSSQQHLLFIRVVFGILKFHTLNGNFLRSLAALKTVCCGLIVGCSGDIVNCVRVCVCAFVEPYIGDERDNRANKTRTKKNWTDKNSIILASHSTHLGLHNGINYATNWWCVILDHAKRLFTALPLIVFAC